MEKIKREKIKKYRVVIEVVFVGVFGLYGTVYAASVAADVGALLKAHNKVSIVKNMTPLMTAAQRGDTAKG